MTDQHESWHTDAECIYAVQGRYIFQFFMADGRHLKNRKIALSHDDAERVSPAHLSSWIFIINIFQRHVYVTNPSCIIVPNFVEIGHIFAETLRFLRLVLLNET